MSPSLRAGGLSEPEAGAEPGPEGLRLGEPPARREQRGIISNGVNSVIYVAATFRLRYFRSGDTGAATIDGL